MCVAVVLAFFLTFAFGSPENRYRQSVDLLSSVITLEETTFAITEKNNVDYDNFDKSSQLDSDYKDETEATLEISSSMPLTLATTMTQTTMYNALKNGTTRTMVDNVPQQTSATNTGISVVVSDENSLKSYSDRPFMVATTGSTTTVAAGAVSHTTALTTDWPPTAAATAEALTTRGTVYHASTPSVSVSRRKPYSSTAATTQNVERHGRFGTTTARLSSPCVRTSHVDGHVTYGGSKCEETVCTSNYYDEYQVNIEEKNTSWINCLPIIFVGLVLVLYPFLYYSWKPKKHESEVVYLRTNNCHCAATYCNRYSKTF